jgi:hypothetical protein
MNIEELKVKLSVDGIDETLAKMERIAELCTQISGFGMDVAPKTIEVDCWVYVFSADEYDIHTSPWSPNDLHPRANQPEAQFRITRSITAGCGLDAPE